MKFIKLTIYLLLFLTLAFFAKRALAEEHVVWDAETRLTNDSAASSIGPNNGWAVATDSAGRVHVIWADQRDGHWEIYYKRWNGSSWDADQRLSTPISTGDSTSPAIAVDGTGIIHVTWLYYTGSAYRIRYSRSTDNGQSWSDYVDWGSVGTNNAPAICASGNTVYVFSTWKPAAYPQIIEKHSTSNGAPGSWTGVYEMTSASSYKENPVGAFGPDGAVHVVWQDTRDNNPNKREIYYQRYKNSSWLPADKRLTWDPANGSADQTIAVGNDNKVHVVWHDDRDTDGLGHHIWKIYYKASPDGGTTWPHNSTGDDYDALLTPNKENYPAAWDPGDTVTETDLPSVTVDRNGGVHVLWDDKVLTDPDLLDYQIDYKYFDGSAWQDTVVLNASISGYPSIAVDSNNRLHTIRMDGRFGSNTEIYYKRGFQDSEFVSIVDTGGAADSDYSSLSAWEQNVQTNLTAASTKVFSGAITGAISDINSVTLYRGGSSQGVTAAVVHASKDGSRLLLENISNTNFYYQNGDQWRVDGSHYFTIDLAIIDLPTAVAKCRATTGLADTSAVTIDGWTTSATNYIKIWTDPSENYRHQGKWDDTKYRLETSTYAIANYEDYVRIDGLQAKSTATTFTSIIGLDGGMDIRVSNNLVIGPANADFTVRDISWWDNKSGSIGKFWNNICYNNFIGIGAGTYGVAFTMIVYNNTVYSAAHEDNTSNFWLMPAAVAHQSFISKTIYRKEQIMVTITILEQPPILLTIFPKTYLRPIRVLLIAGGIIAQTKLSLSITRVGMIFI